MSNGDGPKSQGGIAPYGYRWQNSSLVVEESEAPIRRLIFELFLKHRRKKTVAKLLNDLGYRTRNGAPFSDTTVGRLLIDTTAKGLREVNSSAIEVEPVVSTEIWEQANKILGDPKPKKQSLNLFSGIVYCGCGGPMLVPSNSPKYVCRVCRSKIGIDDLETIFQSQLKDITLSETDNLFDQWPDLNQKDKRVIIEQTCNRIVVERDAISIEFGYSPNSPKTLTVEQQDTSGNEAADNQVIAVPAPPLNEPLLSEAAAARFLGISKMTVLRKRNAGELGFFKIGIRILYSKEKHLIPFLTQRESKRTSA